MSTLRFVRAVLLGIASSAPLACAPAMNVDQRAVAPTDAEPNVPLDPGVAHANHLAGAPGTYRSGFSGSGDKRLHYVEAGAGETVIFVHGFPSFWYVWRDQMEALRACKRVIAVDAIGSGLSAKPTDTASYRIGRLAERLDTFIRELAPGEKVTLVGHDWGGALVWSYAQTAPDNVQRIAIFSAPPYNLLLDLLTNDAEQREASRYMPTLVALEKDAVDKPEFSTSMFNLAYGEMIESNVLSKKEGELFEHALSRQGALYGGIQWYKANIPDFDNLNVDSLRWPTQSRPVQVPVLLIRGATDRTFVKAMAEHAQSETPDLKVVYIEGVGHWTPFQDASAASELKQFLVEGAGACVDRGAQP